MLFSMLCWGSWANTQKIDKRWRFELFYWDYVCGLLACALLAGLTLGNVNPASPDSFFRNLGAAGARSLLEAFFGGVIFNLGNLLLVAAISVAGMAVAFPIGAGLALVIGAVINYIISPKGNPVLLFGGVLLVVFAIVTDALAYRRRETTQKALSARGLQISLACGILMGTFYPLVAKAIRGDNSLGPYSVAFFFAIGTALCAIPVNYFFMRKPLTGGAPVSLRDYVQGHGSWHWWGILGGFIWCTGAVLNFVASHAHIIGPAISYTIGQGATMVSAIWGVFVWKEFANAPNASRKLIPLMFIFFLVGLGAVALAPVVPR